ncbi:XRE family transcriptional regulator [Tsukamurella sp. 8F]|uniref:helix-turn-helix domain-containing protein n=1 Tax=unclassified Tsukamurella TaxID=2633480 RepID=UPI0023B9E3A1|nr:MULTISPECIES: XRE family transcriptional regulator [unclassified Tsukamurella]MDF0528952.1 XRE family transcriptional regulator [Tsukamurella sp. 8J]MDF0589156.1 XRE family transcriptional regulator [Tsukamurella sp. 8F]
MEDARDDSWIGRRVGRHRRDRGWTLAALADKIGLSAPQLSRIESGARQPSVGTLIEIAHAFGVSLSQLVDEQYSAPYHLIRSANRIERPSANGSLASLSGDFPGLQAVHLAVPPSSEAPAARHGGEEWLYVLAGDVEVRIGEADETLAAGDAIHFPSNATHSVRTVGEIAAELLIVSTATTG